MNCLFLKKIRKKKIDAREMRKRLKRGSWEKKKKDGKKGWKMNCFFFILSSKGSLLKYMAQIFGLRRRF